MNTSSSLNKLVLLSSSFACLGISYLAYQHYPPPSPSTQPKFTYTQPQYELDHVKVEVTQMIQRIIKSKKIPTTLQHEAQLAHTLLQSLSHQQHYETQLYYKLAKSLAYYHQLLTAKKNKTTPPKFPSRLFVRETYPKHSKQTIQQFKYYLEAFASYHYGSINIKSPHAVPLPQHALHFFRSTKHAYGIYTGHNFNPYFFAAYQELAKSMLSTLNLSMNTHTLSPKQHAYCDEGIESFTRHLLGQMHESVHRIKAPISKRPYKKRHTYLLKKYGD